MRRIPFCRTCLASTTRRSDTTDTVRLPNGRPPCAHDRFALLYYTYVGRRRGRIIIIIIIPLTRFKSTALSCSVRLRSPPSVEAIHSYS